MNLFEEIDWHLRRHGLGHADDRGVRFDWESLRRRRLLLIPSFEMPPGPIYRTVREHVPDARYFETGAEATAPPDPDGADFFILVVSAIASIADPAGDLIYVSFYTEECYLAVTPEAALTVFGENGFDLLARSLAACVADGSLEMRRHRHGIRIFRDALIHFNTLREQMNLPDSVML